jgi:hypothetical protein
MYFHYGCALYFYFTWPHVSIRELGFSALAGGPGQPAVRAGGGADLAGVGDRPPLAAHGLRGAAISGAPRSAEALCS